MVYKNILITGGAGYLGSMLTGQLLDKGHDVTVVDKLLFDERSLLSYVSNPDFEFVYGDVRDQGLMSRVIKDKDVIIPLAGIVGMPACDASVHDAYSTNRDAVELVDNLRTSSQLVVFPNTNSGYGHGNGKVACTESDPLTPISVYGRSKCDAEKLLFESGKPTIGFRLATVFGVSPRMRLDLLVNDFTYKAVTDGSLVMYEPDAMRNYVHVADVGRAFIHAIEHADEMVGEIYNVGREDANCSKRELAEKINEYVPGFAPVVDEFAEDPDKRDYIVSNDKIHAVGFRPSISLEEGIVELVKAYSMLAHNRKFTNL